MTVPDLPGNSPDPNYIKNLEYCEEEDDGHCTQQSRCFRHSHIVTLNYSVYWRSGTVITLWLMLWFHNVKFMERKFNIEIAQIEQSNFSKYVARIHVKINKTYFSTSFQIALL